MQVAADCLYFKGDVPCTFHKQLGSKCRCTNFRARGRRILIIKLGAIGDVIRTTPLLRRLKADEPNCHVTWLTLTPEVLPNVVDHALAFSAQNLAYLQATEFDALFNLDKDREACAVAKLVSAPLKRGFTLKDGHCVPLDELAQHKFLTGIDDDLNRTNVLSYPREIFDMVGLSYESERYLYDAPVPFSDFPAMPGPVVGLNTGCGARWPTRLWEIERWVELAVALREFGYGVLLLGGKDEDERNKRIADAARAVYLGYHSIPRFASLISHCDLVVTGVTMAMHMVIGLEKKIVLMNNIFNRHEFELYGLGEIVEPTQPCSCYFKGTCVSASHCMKSMTVQTVLDAVLRNLPAAALRVPRPDVAVMGQSLTL